MGKRDENVVLVGPDEIPIADLRLAFLPRVGEYVDLMVPGEVSTVYIVRGVQHSAIDMKYPDHAPVRPVLLYVEKAE